LLLHWAPTSARYFQGAKVDITLSEYIICFAACTSRVGLNVPKLADVVIWESERNRIKKFVMCMSKQKQKKTEFANKVMSGKPHRISSNEFKGLLKDLELLKS
jgi:hypothetical protein